MMKKLCWLRIAYCAFLVGSLTIASSQPVVTPPPFTAQNPTLGTLPSYNDASANWKMAGLLSVGGIPTRSTQCGATVTPSGLTPPIANDDAAKINAAIQACTGGIGGAGQVVQLAAGAFQIAMSEFIQIDRGITLRGSGSCTNGSSPYCATSITVINGALPYISGGACGVDLAHQVACVQNPVIYMGPPNTYFTNNNTQANFSACGHNSTLTGGCTPTLAADAVAGQTTIQVSSTTPFSVGMWVMIDEEPSQVSTANPLIGFSYPNFMASPEIFNASGSPKVMREAWGDGSCNYSFCTDRVNEEIHLITAKGTSCPGAGCTLTFDSPLTLAFRVTGHGGNVYWPADSNGNPVSFVQYAGVENISIFRPTDGGINMVFCAYCWVKGVEVGQWFAGSVNMNWTVRDQIEFNYFHDCYQCENNGAEYPIGISTATTEAYVANNIIVKGGKGMVGRAANTAVVAYNYVDMTFYETIPSQIGDYWVDMGLNGSHYVGTHHFLFEGNWGSNCDNDDTHGNAIYHTYFRNWCTGLRTSFTDPSLMPPNNVEDDFGGIGYSGTSGSIASATPGALRAVGPMALDYWMAFVGNVLGMSGKTDGAHGWAYLGNYTTTKTIWMSGWKDGNGGNDPYLDGTNGTYLHKHGNYDYFHNSVFDWNASFSKALPNSYYLSSRPAFFGPGPSCTYTWPWITPETGTQIHNNSCGNSGLPAKARYDAGTPFVQP